ncbi:hypothetical protein NL108_011275 [Boleophthalmus pectinirostris]|nr:hypothetical protein NL108_011275 [Boleophthalmus pectinirostris]
MNEGFTPKETNSTTEKSFLFHFHSFLKKLQGATRGVLKSRMRLRSRGLPTPGLNHPEFAANILYVEQQQNRIPFVNGEVQKTNRLSSHFVLVVLQQHHVLISLHWKVFLGEQLEPFTLELIFKIRNQG